MSSGRVAIIVPVRKGSSTVRETISDLLEQCRPLDAEVIAVVSESDPTRHDVSGWNDPHLKVLVRPGQQAVPQLRRDGALSTHAEWVIITEDHCRFPKSWLKDLLETQRTLGRVVVGGPVENGRCTPVGWAQYFTR